MDEKAILRHLLAALKYRFARAIGNARDEFPSFDAGAGVRTPIEIIAHMSYVLRLAQTVFKEDVELKKETGTWQEEIELFYKEVERLDTLLLLGLPKKEKLEKVIQGPLSDALTHVGQLLTLRRLSGDPVSGESYFKAEIHAPILGD